MDAAHREDGALERIQRGGDLAGAVTGRHEAVLEDHTRVDLALDEGQEFCRARVGVRRVHRARVEEDDGGADVLVGQDGECLDVGGTDAAALARRCSSVEVEDDLAAEGVAGAQVALAVDEEALEALDGGGRVQEAEGKCRRNGGRADTRRRSDVEIDSPIGRRRGMIDMCPIGVGTAMCLVTLGRYVYGGCASGEQDNNCFK